MRETEARDPNKIPPLFRFYTRMASNHNFRAKEFKGLHKPGSPLIVANVFDAASAKIVAALPQAKAVATASYAVAAAAGVHDDDLDLETSLRATRAIARVVAESGLPITVDLQDGYGDQLEHAITEILKIGVVGINLEDYDRGNSSLYDVDEAAARIKKVLQVADSCGVSDFVVNARCDALVQGRELSEVINRGKAYLAAGATTVFVWGGPARGGTSREEVAQLVKAFDGRLSVWMKLSGGLNGKSLADIGVARISVGPTLQMSAMEKFKQEAVRVLRGLE